MTKFPLVAALTFLSSYLFAEPPPGKVWEPIPELTDEFNAPALDAAKWLDHSPGWEGRQPGYFAKSNVVVAEGELRLTARAEEPPAETRERGYHTYTTACVKGKTGVRYGYFEIQARGMDSKASSAFWFYSRDPAVKTEIDVFEIRGGDTSFSRQLFMTLHHNNFPNPVWPGVDDKYHPAKVLDLDFRPVDGFHVYGLEWDEKEIKWYTDGKLLLTRANEFWHEEMDLILDSETFPTWFGLPPVETLPTTFRIDYVRGWREKR
jgi:beta-glucanase (GH16 family)